MEEKKRTIVMFGDSLTDYFPMEKLKDIDAQFINSGVQGIRSQRWVQDWLMTYFHINQISLSCKVVQMIS